MRHTRISHGLISTGTAIGLGFAPLAMSCLRVNPDHCALHGGDIACDGARVCVAAVGGESSSIRHADDNGCIAEEPIPADDFVRVRYGFPRGVRNVDRHLPTEYEGSDTVEGIVRRELAVSGLVFDESVEGVDMVLDGLEPLEDLRNRLENAKTTSLREFAVSDVRLPGQNSEKEEIEAINRGVDQLIELFGGVETTGDTMDDTGTTTEGTSSESGTTGPSLCTDNSDCTDIAAPYCSADGVCVPCGDAPQPADGDEACATADAQRPLCVDDTCEPCREGETGVCDDQMLWCDVETNDCLPCTEYAQCTSGACELSLEVGMGRCFPLGTRVVTVDDTDTASKDDFTSINAAVASIGMGEYGIVRAHELDMGASYQGQVLVDQGKTIALLAVDSETPVIQGTVMNPGLRIETAGTRLFVDGLTISGSLAQGVIVDEAFAWFDRSRIVANDGGGIRAGSASVLTLRSSFVGGVASDVDAIEFNGSSLDILYTTVGGGTVLAGRARALYCTSGMVNVRNSILVSADPMPEVECPGVILTNSATEADVMGFDSLWFNGYAAGIFSLSASGEMTFQNIAQWVDGDPITDIEGDPRPVPGPMNDYAGADVP